MNKRLRVAKNGIGRDPNHLRIHIQLGEEGKTVNIDNICRTVRTPEVRTSFVVTPPRNGALDVDHRRPRDS